LSRKRQQRRNIGRWRTQGRGSGWMIHDRHRPTIQYYAYRRNSSSDTAVVIIKQQPHTQAALSPSPT
jgi:hypothetical protein